MNSYFESDQSAKNQAGVRGCMNLIWGLNGQLDQAVAVFVPSGAPVCGTVTGMVLGNMVLLQNGLPSTLFMPCTQSTIDCAP